MIFRFLFGVAVGFILSTIGNEYVNQLAEEEDEDDD
jgi:hypothetical protein